MPRQLFAALDERGESKVRLSDFHAHLTQKLGFALSDEEWATLSAFLDADADGTLSYGEIFVLLATSPTKKSKAMTPERRKFSRSTGSSRRLEL